MDQTKKFIIAFLKVISFIVLLLLLIINIIYISQIINVAEVVEISSVSLINHFFTILFIIIILLLLFFNKKYKIINLKSNKTIIILLIIYAIICYKWINYSNNIPVDDSDTVYSLAKSVIENGIDSIQHNDYLERCPQQIFMVLFFTIIFKLFSSTAFLNIQLLNIVANIFIILGIYKITRLLTSNKEYAKEISFFLTITFFPLIIISNFVYSDYIGLSFVIWSFVYLLDYNKNKKKSSFILSAILLSVALMIKMNYFIILIAYIIYLIIKILGTKIKGKRLLQIGLLILYVSINLIPYLSIKQWSYSKLKLNSEESMPAAAYVYMGMSESYRGAGWYGTAISDAWNNTNESKDNYLKLISRKIETFINKPSYFLDFYKRKITSGWADPTFQSVWYGIPREEEHLQNVLNSTKYHTLLIYSRALLIMVYGFSLFTLLYNWKKINEDKMLLYLIFLGGFFFHLLWEMKSRYTMPYVIMLIPLVAIGINDFFNLICNKLQEYKNKRSKTEGGII